ncbi:MAG: CoA-binding protein [Deltaproteobacteria bacterium]|nr:CoA-binding protein [Deltaproteobacteria bacterium]
MNHETKTSLDRMFFPRGLALIGASSTPGKMGAVFTEGIIRMGYTPLYPVNPKEQTIFGLRAYPTVSDIEGPVDLAIILLPTAAVRQTVEECARKGVAGAVIFSAGFGEQGEEGLQLQEEIVGIARRAGMRLIGPNGLGFYCPASKIASFPKVLMEKVEAPCGRVGGVSQSGSFLDNLTIVGTALGFGFSKLVSSGNESDLTAVDFLEYLGQDADTEIIVSYLEGVRNGTPYIEAAKKISRRKPIIVWKTGITESGARAASSHTGSLAGSREIWEGMFRQAGIVVVRSQEEMIDDLIAFHYLPPPRGRRVAILSGPGGIGVGAADTCADHGLQVVGLSEETRRQLSTFIPSVGTALGNPVDMGPAILVNPEIPAQATAIVAADPRVDMVLLIGTDIPGFREGIAEVVKTLDKPLVTAQTSLPQHIPEEYNYYAGRGIPVYADASRAARSLAALAHWHEWRSRQ